MDRLAMLVPVVTVAWEEGWKLDGSAVVWAGFSGRAFKNREIGWNVLNNFLSSDGFSKGDDAGSLREIVESWKLQISSTGASDSHV